MWPCALRSSVPPAPRPVRRSPASAAAAVTPPVVSWEEKLGWMIQSRRSAYAPRSQSSTSSRSRSCDAHSAGHRRASATIGSDSPARRQRGARPASRRAFARTCRPARRRASPDDAAGRADPEPEVRQMAAFALGLVGDPSARPALVAALADPDRADAGPCCRRARSARGPRRRGRRWRHGAAARAGRSAWRRRRQTT